MEVKGLISIVIPCYNSEKTIEQLVRITMEELEQTPYSCEFILVNDSSKDNTFEAIKRLTEKYPYVIGIDLAKNSGQHNALMAALHQVRGEIIVGMDDDMQTHPSQLPKLLDKLNCGYDLVYGKYEKKKENALRRWFSSLNNYTLGKMINQPKEITTSSYWVAKRFLVEEIKKYPHSYSNLRGLFFRSTNNVGNVEIKHFERAYGTSNYTLKSLMRLWSSCLNFSIIPLRIFLVIGFITAIIGFIGFILIVVQKLLGISILAGWSSTMSAIFFFSGIILTCLGVIGEYIGRIFMCINQTPQYVIRDIIDHREDENE